ncbi:hypothetical protein E4U39_000484 [Claviceps sp. Clav50 group G5]|nr:hypothetical protein E4U39_000484 [Claviceps sp. Clav50 group G5]
MSDVISENSGQGSKEGRPWSNAELFTFVGFFNDERNDGALQNTTPKHAAPTLRKASEVMTAKFPQRRWNPDTTMRQQFNRLQDDWREFKKILEASGGRSGMMRHAASSFSGAQREGFIHKFGSRASRIIDHGLPINERLDISRRVEGENIVSFKDVSAGVRLVGKSISISVDRDV